MRGRLVASFFMLQSFTAIRPVFTLFMPGFSVPIPIEPRPHSDISQSYFGLLFLHPRLIPALHKKTVPVFVINHTVFVHLHYRETYP